MTPSDRQTLIDHIAAAWALAEERKAANDAHALAHLDAAVALMRGDPPVPVPAEAAGVRPNAGGRRGGRVPRRVQRVSPRTGLPAGVPYPCVADAAAAVGVSESSVKRALSGARLLAGGWRWAYVAVADAGRAVA